MQLVQCMDVEVGEGARGSADIVPTPALRLDMAQVNPEKVVDTPEKAHLRRQVSDLVDALQYEGNKVHQEIHEVKVDAGNKVKALFKDQQANFQRVATEYEQQARDICQKEVAEAIADIHGQAISAINEREQRLNEEHVKLAKLKADIAQAQSAVGTEASQKTQIIKEAESAIQRQRSEIINQAEQTVQHQSALVKKQIFRAY